MTPAAPFSSIDPLLSTPQLPVIMTVAGSMPVGRRPFGKSKRIWLVQEDASDRVAWNERLAEWVQTELKPRAVPAGTL
jgi:hypothetical protein